MKVTRVCVKSFNTPEEKDVYTVSLPQGSQFVKLKLLPDGIYAFYIVPSIEVTNDMVDKFVIVKPEAPVPDSATFIDVLDVIMDAGPERGQVVVLFPVFKLN